MNNKEFLNSCSTLFCLQFTTSELIKFNSFIKDAAEHIQYQVNVLRHSEDSFMFVAGPSSKLGVYFAVYNNKEKEVKVIFKNGYTIILNENLLLLFLHQRSLYSHDYTVSSLQTSLLLERVIELSHKTPGLFSNTPWAKEQIDLRGFSALFKKKVESEDDLCERVRNLTYQTYQFNRLLELIVEIAPLDRGAISEVKRLIITLKRMGLKYSNSYVKYANWSYERRKKNENKKELSGFVKVEATIAEPLRKTSFTKDIATSSIIHSIRRFTYVTSRYNFNEKLDGEIVRVNDEGKVTNQGFYKEGKRHGTFTDYLHKRRAEYVKGNKFDGGKL